MDDLSCDAYIIRQTVFHGNEPSLPEMSLANAEAISLIHLGSLKREIASS
jgi:hypothetical protein